MAADRAPIICGVIRPSNSRAPSRCQDSATVVTVTELADIEENVWSPRFGLKGKIDVTARVRIQRRSHRTLEEKTVPLELKTGKESNSIEHRSQVILYTLMSLERYNPEAGFLLYLKTGNLHPVVPTHMDRRELLKLRNTLVHYIHNCVEKEEKQSRLSRLPDILTNRQTCQYCPQKRNCALYERAVDGNSADVSEDVVRDFLQQETGHLTPPHLSYFSHWLLLCCLEAATMEAKNGRKRVWLRTPEESPGTPGAKPGKKTTSYRIRCQSRRLCLVPGLAVFTGSSSLPLQGALWLQAAGCCPSILSVSSSVSSSSSLQRITSEEGTPSGSADDSQSGCSRTNGFTAETDPPTAGSFTLASAQREGKLKTKRRCGYGSYRALYLSSWGDHSTHWVWIISSFQLTQQTATHLISTKTPAGHLTGAAHDDLTLYELELSACDRQFVSLCQRESPC
ncbi:DNA replication ATP-dependent helicase/nuclease DNA2-like [Morone saxatilis]|uniref:DNA replication ATP-dependent helicase/nuclease DNA2-like n=1 Tax=Morone saxatilis TaxID=34816 RepID=UPI0015E215B2|nr:DNA replication ATP-dependent helicase/nuclease DNA2-like [Morone saxatilis]